MLNPDEMAMPDEKAVMTAISTTPGYEEMFTKAYPNDKHHWLSTIFWMQLAAFERILFQSRDGMNISEGNRMPWPKWKNTDWNIYGCRLYNVPCRQFVRRQACIRRWVLFILMRIWADTGRYEITKNVSDKYMFRVSQLRNIALDITLFPWWQIPTLEDAVKKMGSMNLGKDLNPKRLCILFFSLAQLSDVNLEKKMAKK